MSKKLYTSTKLNALKRKESEPWLYSYSDLITNLLALFIVLLVVQSGSTVTQENLAQGIKEYVEKVSGGPHSPTGHEELDRLLSEITEYLKVEKITEDVAVQPDWMGVDVTFGSGVLFGLGDASLSAQAERTLAGIAHLLKKVPKGFVIEVEGHADNLPVTSGKFPSNWELSSARAGSVVRVLESHGISSTKLKAIGFSNSRPVNASGEGAANRRVIIKINKETGRRT